ncbi:oligosaccharide flippase family protein [Cedecea neteri]|uniref:Putative O-antigen transporter n=1 Tax=Cedecea neteri TaxID=158822 RepID=A0A291DVZ5_9ENTR|nr:oligosaccharide flippase family protein [Cedecea neteri]ATF91964.1 polysaccharide biosynthesis protein [Cedecea neteri]
MIKRGVLYIILNYLIQCLNMILSLLLMRYLSSGLLGDLSLARTWQQFVDYSHLGARFALDRYVPTSEEDERQRLLSTVLAATIIGGLFVIVAALLFNEYNYIVIILTVSGIFIAIGNVFKTYLRATNNLNDMLAIVFLSQLLPILIPLGIYCYTKDFFYFLFATLICYVLSVTYILINKRQLLDYRSLKSLLRVYKKISLPSFYLFINSLFIFLYLVMDRFFIDYSSGRAALGDYSVITFAFSALMIIPATVAELLYVKIIKQSSTVGRVLFIKEALLIVAITIIGVVVANPVMSFFIVKFTKYGDLLRDMHYATLAVIPFALTAIYYHVSNGLDLRKQMIMVNAAVCIILCVLYVIPIFHNLKYSLHYYVLIKAATGWLVFIGYSFFIWKHTRKLSIKN